MVATSFPIFFEFRLDRTAITISLQAEVEIHDNPLCHVVRNIRSRHNGTAPAIPDLKLMKKDSAWVHLDSEISPDLSVCIGRELPAEQR